MLTVRIINDATGTDDSASYDYYVFVNNQEIARGHVDGHNRNKGFSDLLRMIADKEENKTQE